MGPRCKHYLRVPKAWRSSIIMVVWHESWWLQGVAQTVQDSYCRFNLRGSRAIRAAYVIHYIHIPVYAG